MYKLMLWSSIPVSRACPSTTKVWNSMHQCENIQLLKVDGPAPPPPPLSLFRLYAGAFFTVNCVEYWNWPVPSTMMSMPLPRCVPALPGRRVFGTFHTYFPFFAGTFSTMAFLLRTQFVDGPLQRTSDTVWPAG